MVKLRIIKGGKNMQAQAQQVQVVEDIEEPRKTYMRDIKKLIQDSMKEKGITPTEARKSLGIKRYEK